MSGYFSGEHTELLEGVGYGLFQFFKILAILLFFFNSPFGAGVKKHFFKKIPGKAHPETFVRKNLAPFFSIGGYKFNPNPPLPPPPLTLPTKKKKPRLFEGALIWHLMNLPNDDLIRTLHNLHIILYINTHTRLLLTQKKKFVEFKKKMPYLLFGKRTFLRI